MQEPGRRRPRIPIIRRPRVRPVTIDISTDRPRRPKPLTPLILAYGFGALIALGTFFLALPISSSGSGFTPFVTSLFTATSAVTVTGLTVEDSATFWSPFGKAVVLVLIQVGGLGFMTYSTLIFLVLGRKIGLRERLFIGAESGFGTAGGMVRLIKQVGLVMFAVEALGFVALAIRFSFDFPIPTALWHSLFHSVSAFNNAGFIVLPDAGLAAYRQDASVLMMTVVLFVLGSISFAVMADIARRRSFGRLSLDSKIVLSATAGLWVVGMLLFLVSEYSNPESIGPMGIPGKLMSSFFESTSGRTAGFSSIAPGGFTQSTLFLGMGLMFIGGAAGSTAGGIKVNTFGVIVAAVIATIRGRPQVEAFKREIPTTQVLRALSIGVLGVTAVFSMAFLLTEVEDARFIELLFETVSAFGTSGYSTGLPGHMSNLGQLLLALAMFLGRTAPLTLILALSQKAEAVRYRYAQERIRMG